MMKNNPEAEIGDVFPTISIDRAYGEELHSIEVDLKGITTLLREKGMSDEEINAFSIIMTGSSHESTTEIHRVRASYKNDTKEVMMYKPADMTSSVLNYVASDGEIIHTTLESTSAIEYALTNDLVHEFEHAYLADDAEVQRQTSSTQKE